MVRSREFSPIERQRTENRACYEAPGVPWHLRGGDNGILEAV